MGAWGGLGRGVRRKKRKKGFRLIPEVRSETLKLSLLLLISQKRPRCGERRGGGGEKP